MTAYDRIRFIGYPIPTDHQTEFAVGNVGNMMVGTYLGDDDLHTDVAKRVAVLSHAVTTAKALLPSDEEPGSVLNVFVAPEFFWHGTQGPYVFQPDERDPAEVILEAVDAAFPAEDFADWLLVCGTVISTQVADRHALWAEPSIDVRNDTVRALTEQYRKASGAITSLVYDMLRGFVVQCHSYPNVEVRNRSIVLSRVPVDGVRATLQATLLTTEKYYDSNEDFLLYDVTGRRDVITEQMTAYPILDLTGGDDKRDPRDPYAIFRHVYGVDDHADIGVEICLDHADNRLRRSIASPAWPVKPDGLHLHLLPSCGMQLTRDGIAAGVGGWAFNCDGEYAIAGDHPTGTPTAGSPNGVTSIYTDVVSEVSAHYSGHTQLARVTSAAQGGDPRDLASRSASYETLDADIATVHPVTALDDLGSVFAGGPGALHIYGLTSPLPFSRTPASAD
ncbi:hypothetical protein ACFQZV_13170 [Microbacterium koreense]|uniref:Uncharacterized protein n=1 Tax=Microbacterium koreense TaxID=323761 RepID=A0ABW2ZU99_9MICO